MARDGDAEIPVLHLAPASRLAASPQCSLAQRRTLPGFALVLMILGSMVCPAAANVIVGNQHFVGDTTIAAGDTVLGNVTIRRGTLTVEGTVEGNIVQLGAGDVLVGSCDFFSFGIVRGSIYELGSGDVFICFGSVEGDVNERGSGSVFGNTGSIIGNVSESFEGEVLVTMTYIEGDIVERGPGDVEFSDDQLEGNIHESGDGDATAVGFATVFGDVTERGRGSLRVEAFSGVNSASEWGPGDVVVAIGQVYGDVREHGFGEVFVWNMSRIDGDIYESGFGDLTISCADLVGDAYERGPGTFEEFFPPECPGPSP